MTDPAFKSLQEVVTHAIFPGIDVRLREGGHIDESNLGDFGFLADAQPYLEAFYDGYGCDLIHSVDGYFYLRPRGGQLGQSHLSAGEMLVGQALCLLRLDPGIVQTMGRVPLSRVLELLESLIGAKELAHALNPRIRRNRAVEADEIRKEVRRALRGLERLGFVDRLKGGDLQVRSAALRFAEAVARSEDRAAELRRLVALGEVVFETTGEDS